MSWYDKVTKDVRLSSRPVGTSLGGAINVEDGLITIVRTTFSLNNVLSENRRVSIPQESNGGAINVQSGLVHVSSCRMLSNYVVRNDTRTLLLANAQCTRQYGCERNLDLITSQLRKTSATAGARCYGLNILYCLI